MEAAYEKRGYLLEDFRLFHLRDDRGTTVDYHYHEFYKVLLLLSGTGSYAVEGRRYQLRPGDLVLFMDISGAVHGYEVVLLETLPKEATKEMIASGFDLSLYTCTIGGGSRVTVRCRAITPE